MASGKATIPVRVGAAGAAAAIVGLLALALVFRAGAGEDPYTALGLVKAKALQPAAPFTLATPGGPAIQLAQYRGKVVFLNFWATWCPPCREEMPAMERLYRRFKDEGLVVLAVSVDVQGAAAVTPFLEEQKFTYPIGLDPEMVLARLYAVRVLPTTFLVDRQGRLAGSALGPREWDAPEAAALLTSLLQGK